VGCYWAKAKSELSTHDRPRGWESVRFGHGNGLSLMPWSDRFHAPIEPPKGKPLLTLKDAADYIMKLQETEQQHPAWQTAIEALILVAETDGPTMFARIGVMRALNHHHQAASAPRQKQARKYKVVR
jgi:hypothetical protein